MRYYNQDSTFKYESFLVELVEKFAQDKTR